MSFTLDDFYEGSFRGIPFLIDSEQTIAGGNKLALSSPPNSSITYGENLGTKSKKFTIKALLQGDNYVANRAALEQALDDGTIGVLIHPFRGSQSVQCLDYTVVEDFGKIGVITYSISFIATVPAINPKVTSDILSDIVNTANNLDAFLQNEVIGVFKVSSEFSENFADAKAKINQISQEFNVFKSLIGTGSDTSNFDQENKQFLASTSTNIKNPDQLSDGISSLFGFANSISTDAMTTGNAFVGMFTFAQVEARVPTIPTMSDQAQERINNRVILNYTFSVYSLLYAYLNFSQAVFTDTTQLNLISQTLEEQYLKLVNGTVTERQSINVLNYLGLDTLNELEKLRNLTRIQFNTDSNNTSNIVQIQVNNQLSVSLISYNYYGNTGQAQSLIDLNNITAASFASGTLNTRTVQ